MPLRNPTSIAVAAIHEACCAAEEEFLVHLQDFVVPEFVNVQDIGGQEFCCDSSGKIFNPLTIVYQRMNSRCWDKSYPIQPPASAA